MQVLVGIALDVVKFSNVKVLKGTGVFENE